MTFVNGDSGDLSGEFGIVDAFSKVGEVSIMSV
jgi:hypothetical protein